MVPAVDLSLPVCVKQQNSDGILHKFTSRKQVIKDKSGSERKREKTSEVTAVGTGVNCCPLFKQQTDNPVVNHVER